MLLSAGGLWSDGDVAVAAVQLGSAPGFPPSLVCTAMETCAPVAERHPTHRHEGMNRSLLALNVGPLRLGPVSLPRQSRAEPGGSSRSLGATGGFAKWRMQPGCNVGTLVGVLSRQLAEAPTRCRHGKGSKLLRRERCPWLAGFFIHCFGPPGLGIRHLTPSLHEKQWVEEVGAGAPDCGNDRDLSFHSLCLGLSVCNV